MVYLPTRPHGVTSQQNIMCGVPAYQTTRCHFSAEHDVWCTYQTTRCHISAEQFTLHWKPNISGRRYLNGNIRYFMEKCKFKVLMCVLDLHDNVCFCYFPTVYFTKEILLKKVYCNEGNRI